MAQGKRMKDRLFFLPGSVSSIEKLVKATDQKLLKLVNRTFGTQYTRYSPWMSIPAGMLRTATVFDWNPVSRFLEDEDYSKVKTVFYGINPDSELIPTHEEHDLQFKELSQEERQSFNQALKDAESRLFEANPAFGNLLELMLLKYLPFETGGPRTGSQAMSMLWLKGTVLWRNITQIPTDELAESLAHELAHQVIIHYQLNDELIKGDLNDPIYSGVRKTDRPAISSFHAVAALVYMIVFSDSIGNGARKSELVEDLRKGLFALRTLAFTPLGQQIYLEMHEALD